MDLNSEDIYNNIESFKNKHNYTLEKMAEFTGMSDKSAYSGMMKNRRMKLEYLVNLINNTELTLEQIFRPSIIYQQPSSEIEKVEELSPSVTMFSCPDCIEKQKEINDCREKYHIICEELRVLNQKYNKILEDTLESKKETESASSKKVG